MNDLAPQNVVEFLARAADRVGARTALAFPSPGGTTEISFSALWEQVDRTSAGLQKAGLRRGDRAILMIPMSIELYTALLAVLELGAIGVFVDPWVGRSQIAAFAAFAEPAAWIGVGKSHLLRLAAAELRSIRITVTTGRRWMGLAARHTLRSMAVSPGTNTVTPVAADDPALITFTSGSSGVPKGTNRTHRFLTAQHAALCREFPARDDDVDMPMFPVFALNNLASGIPSVVPRMDFRHPDRVDGRVVVGQMRQHGATTCTGSPSFIDRIVGYLEEHPCDRPPLRRVLAGGAPVSDRQLEHWRRVLSDVEIVVVYGSTEAEPVAHLSADERLAAVSDVRPQSPGYCVGRPSPQVEARIIRIHRGPVERTADGWSEWVVARGQIGELVVRGEHVARDYYRNPAAVAENKIRDADGGIWHRMGDTGYIDGRGLLWLTGRTHSTIFRGGVPHHPQLIEQAAAGRDPRIRRVAAIGLRDAALGERVAVVVETDATDFEDEMRTRLLSAELIVDQIVISRRPLPLDPRHKSKIDYQTLRERLG